MMAALGKFASGAKKRGMISSLKGISNCGIDATANAIPMHQPFHRRRLHSSRTEWRGRAYVATNTYAKAGSQGMKNRGPQQIQPIGNAHREKPRVSPSNARELPATGETRPSFVGKSAAARQPRTACCAESTRSRTKDGQKSSRPPFGENHNPKK